MRQRWSPQRFQANAKNQGIDQNTIEHAIKHAKNIIQHGKYILPIFTLRNLSFLAGVEYSFLREIVSREYIHPYRFFYIRKKGRNRRRKICIPNPQLCKVQRFLHKEVLQEFQIHPACFAYIRDSSIVDAASVHVESRWLLKLDIINFFDSISEISVYRAFRDNGFPALISFEMARICTWLSFRNPHEIDSRWKIDHRHNYKIYHRSSISEMGSLPQGAPSSPMLSNIVCFKLDETLEELAVENGLRYTRYSDDLTFSTNSINFNRKSATLFISKVFSILKIHGFEPNKTKTEIIPPSSKKVVLGLNVDKKNVSLDKNVKYKIKQHIHFCLHSDVGPINHAKRKGFSSVIGFRNHLKGLINYAKSIEPEFGEKMLSLYKKIKWPLDI